MRAAAVELVAGDLVDGFASALSPDPVVNLRGVHRFMIK
jgi:hypothetical protein